LKNFPLEEDGSIEFKKSDVAIEFDKVCFGYSDNNYVLHNFSSTISPNSITCITGEENSGKSTLLKLLTCNYRKFSGMILLNDLPLLNYDLQSLRSNTGVMLNEQDIFEGTLLDNITLGKNIGIDDIVKLAKSLNIHSMLLSFPKSFETKISPIGNRLPSSIIKKILLLRAFIHQPRLLILEEPWLGLDDETKISIQNYLLDISKSRTIIIATNDKEFSTKCNKVINLTKLNIA
jgi:ATP-binding cassette, subfamily B, bacterial